MRNSPDPSVHRECERQFIEHVERLLGDERLRVDTTRGRRPVPTLYRQVEKSDREVDLKRLMSQKGLPDRELQNRMPVGRSLIVTLQQPQWLILRKTVGVLKAVCVSPAESLLDNQPPQPMNAASLRQLLTQLSTPPVGVPTTLAILSTSGFDIDAHELVERRSDRTLILVEPNDAGGWNVIGPVETQALVDLFDPEADQAKRQRVRQEIDKNKAEILGSGLAADRLAGATHLPLQLVEGELKSYARENAGLAAKRLDGRMVLYREGSMPPAAAAKSGGDAMPFLQRVKAIFARKGDTEKKIALLAERRTSLSQQRDQSYEEMATLEQKEKDLRKQFKESDGPLSRRRITSQILQLRKDLDRRQQMLNVFNQQINVIGTHLHNLELVQQGSTASLPTAEDLAADAAAAEETLERLQADVELATSAGPAGVGISAEEQALYEELAQEAGDKGSPTRIDLADVEPAAVETPTPAKAASPTAQKQKEPEPG